jgi:hypothetical protein
LEERTIVPWRRFGALARVSKSSPNSFAVAPGFILKYTPERITLSMGSERKS